MKNFLLSLLFASWLMQLYANPIQINLSTGIAENFNTYNAWGIPVTYPDDTWSVMVPGSATYQPAYVSTGKDPVFIQHYSTINPNVSVISPYIYKVPNATVNSVPGDLMWQPPVGQYIYRTQFTYSKNCDAVTAYLTITTLSGGDEVTDLLINGYSQNIQHYKLKFSEAMQNPPAVSQYTIPVNSGDLANGINSVYITVNVNQPSIKVRALIVDAALVINGGILGNDLISTAGSTTSLCQPLPSTINVALQSNPNNSQFSLSIIGPGNANLYNNVSLPASLPVYPATLPTTYKLVIKNLSCVNSFVIPYTILKQYKCPIIMDDPIDDPSRKFEDVSQTNSFITAETGHIIVKKKKSEPATLNIYSVLGNLLKKIDIAAEPDEYRVDLAEFKSGVYLVTVDSYNSHTSIKLAKE